MKMIVPVLACCFLFSCAMVTPQLLQDGGQIPGYTVTSSYIDTLGNFNPGPGWTLSWSDEFNGSTVNPDNWAFDTGTGSGGWGNNELEYYTSRAENANISNGCLLIRALRENYGGKAYTSARLKTAGKLGWTYGKIVAKIRLPYGKGLWPAFWMLGDNFNSAGWPVCGEIDIMELVGGGSTGDRTVNAAAHWNNGGHQYESASYTATRSYASGFHYFELEWNRNFIRFSVDAVQYFIKDINPGTHPELAAFHLPFFLLLNVAVGGNWPGSPDATTVFPQTMTVDWVRVYRTDLSIPSVSFSSPADRSEISGAFSVTGTASSSNTLEGIYISLDGAAFTKANGLENWKSASLNPGPGGHVIRAYAADTLGAVSITNELNVTLTSKPVAIYPTYFPPVGSYDNILGRVDYVNPSDYKVCVFIYVAGSGGENNGWWIKPTGASPFTGIALDGSWSCDYTTGGSDQNASMIDVFLVPATFSGPVTYYNVSANAVASYRMNRGDLTPPSCTVTSPAAVSSAEDTSLTVSGTASDNLKLSGVFLSVNGSDFAMINGTGTGAVSLSWSHAAQIVLGNNTVQVYSEDSGGNRSSTNTLTVNCTGDLTAPVVSVTFPSVSPAEVYGSNLALSGTAKDNLHLEGVYVSVNGSAFDKVPGTDTGAPSSVAWNTPVALNADTNRVLVYSMDYNGNVSPVTTNTVIRTTNLYTLQMPVTRDASIIRDSYGYGVCPDRNFGSDTTVSAANYHMTSSALLAYGLSGLPSPSRIVKCELVYAGDSPGGGALVSVHKVTGAWSESSVTWNTCPAYSADSLNATLYIGTNKTIDITDMVKNALANSESEISVILIPDSANINNYFIRSREYAGGPASCLLVSYF